MQKLITDNILNIIDVISTSVLNPPSISKLPIDNVSMYKWLNINGIQLIRNKHTNVYLIKVGKLSKLILDKIEHRLLNIISNKILEQLIEKYGSISNSQLCIDCLNYHTTVDSYTALNFYDLSEISFKLSTILNCDVILSADYNISVSNLRVLCEMKSFDYYFNKLIDQSFDDFIENRLKISTIPSFLESYVSKLHWEYIYEQIDYLNTTSTAKLNIVTNSMRMPEEIQIKLDDYIIECIYLKCLNILNSIPVYPTYINLIKIYPVFTSRCTGEKIKIMIDKIISKLELVYTVCPSCINNIILIRVSGEKFNIGDIFTANPINKTKNAKTTMY